MNENRHSITLRSASEAADLAVQIGVGLMKGDTLLLAGPIGAGKTHFARQLIQSLLDLPEDVPSPTFTLVQTYDAGIGEIWHADLYRLSDLDEIYELGLVDAFDDAVCLVEWPDRLQGLAPRSALHMAFSPDPDDPDARHVAVTWSDAKWTPRMERILND
jgi:tRNA threonylcarbamoyladenosine biosynthesis protein TsaE